jgi:hypothetical protein
MFTVYAISEGADQTHKASRNYETDSESMALMFAEQDMPNYDSYKAIKQ